MNFRGRAPIAKSLFSLAPYCFGAALLLAAGTVVCQEEATPVAVAEVESRNVFNEVRLSGSVMTPHFSEVSAEVAGMLHEFDVDEGDYAEIGAPLCSLDSTTTRLELEGARAGLAATKAQLTESKRLLREALSLSEDAIVPQTELDAKRADVEILEANLRRQRAETKRLQELLARHKIASPFAGIVGQKKAEIGEWVGRGEAILTLVAIDPLRARFNVPESHYNQISTNTTVRLEFDALPNKTIEAEVTAKIAFGDLESRTFPVRVELPNPGRRIIPGMSCEATFLIAEPASAQAVVVPSDAIVLNPDGLRTVWRLKHESQTPTVEPLTVQIGLALDGKKAVISDRLEAGDRVVTRGNETLEADQPVRVVPSIPGLDDDSGPQSPSSNSHSERSTSDQSQ